MKFISETSRRLVEARKQIKDLETENARLRNELDMLRARYGKQQPVVSSSAKDFKSKKKSHYTQPTIASLCREKSHIKTCNKEQDQSARVITIDHDKYTYKSGVPTAVVDVTASFGPRFLRSTGASSTRSLEIRMERYNRKTKQAELQKRRICNQDLCSEYAYEERLVDEPVDEIVQEFARIFVESEDFTTGYIPRYQLLETDELAIKTRLDENLSFDITVYTDTANSFGYLRQGVEICQRLIYDMGNTDHSGWRPWADGPHLVRLGRNEIQCWTGEHCPSVGNYNGSRVYYALLDLVELRNAISHPQGGKLGKSDDVDRLLRKAQVFCVMLGCESAAVKVRQLRDALLAEANQSWRDLMGLCEMIEHPFHDELLFHPQHGRSLESILFKRRSELQDPRIWDLGIIWADQNGITLARDTYGNTYLQYSTAVPLE
ncbi:hypothetical protein F5B18DRAFT_651077 [Nemania serpens]|nr:hypothetical protein F5B18DRAFT_651077 [Nemania serpens]